MPDKSNLSHLFELSKLSCDENDIDSFSKDMEDIISLMDMIKTADKDIKPLRNDSISYSDLREDIVYADTDCEKIISNNLSIPKII